MITFIEILGNGNGPRPLDAKNNVTIAFHDGYHLLE